MFVPRFRSILLLAAFAITTGCAHTTLRWRGGQIPASTPGPVFVLVEPAPAFPPDRANFPARLLTLVREQHPKAELVHGTEVSGAKLAFEHGARFLLDARILRWRDAQTQYSGEPDRIGIDFRMIELPSSQLVRELEFEAHGPRLAVRDAPAADLLGNRFRKAVRRLLASTHP